MTGRSCQRGGGRLRVFVLGEEAERPITQFVYSTQTQFVTGWLCLGGGTLTWSNLRSQLGGIDVAGICRSNNPYPCACNSHGIFFALLSGDVYKASNKVTDKGTATEHTNRQAGRTLPSRPLRICSGQT